mmetsp:Transcript_1306/g.4544  ORF Transcript_1306/g.4544 Transcript_1306/m.4544 type:complete len:839 (+) Transcript_1306:245-2761(+)
MQQCAVQQLSTRSRVARGLGAAQKPSTGRLPFSKRSSCEKSPCHSSQRGRGHWVSCTLEATDRDIGDSDYTRGTINLAEIRSDADWNTFQQSKTDEAQARLEDTLATLKPNARLDALVVGVGPAGLCLAAELAAQGLEVGLVGPDTPFVNNYGVWVDEFQQLGLEDALQIRYKDCVWWAGDEAERGKGNSLGREYGFVHRGKLRSVLLSRCASRGVAYMNTLVNEISIRESDSVVLTREGASVSAKSVILATGHNRELLEYIEGPPPGWQTAYGVEIRTKEKHGYRPDTAVFMDYLQSDPEESAPEGSWRVPSFLYVLPTDEHTVFLEETCMVSRVQLPFDELKRRLYVRMEQQGLRLDDATNVTMLEEEASWIPLGGTNPVVPQRTLAFGAAAGMVHPASGYSIVNSLSMAKPFAEAVAQGLREGGAALASEKAWNVIWSDDRRRQKGFHVFGMELILSLQLDQLRGFFRTFYRLPAPLWQGFLSHKLSGLGLVGFAAAVFVIGDNPLRVTLLSHLVSPANSGKRLLDAYLWPVHHLLNPGNEEQPGTTHKRRARATMIEVVEGEQMEQSKYGLPAGFQSSAGWWAVGSNVDAYSSRHQGGDAKDTMAFHDGGAALIVQNLVQKAALDIGDHFGDKRNTYIPSFVLAVAPAGVIPPHLTGDLPGDCGWDPLELGKEGNVEAYREHELIHGRWAMLAIAGILVTDLLGSGGLFGRDPAFQWWSVGTSTAYLGVFRSPLETTPLLVAHLALMGLSELFRSRTIPFRPFEGLDQLYPGGPFDPLKLATHVSSTDLELLKVVEIKHGRLAMMAVLACAVEAVMTNSGPCANLFHGAGSFLY